MTAATTNLVALNMAWNLEARNGGSQPRRWGV
jgi:hypothetical protein